VFNWLLPQMRGTVRVMNDHLLDEVAAGKRNLLDARPTFHYLNPSGRPYALVDHGHREMIQELSWESTVKQLGWRARFARRVYPYEARAEKRIPYAVKDSADLPCDWNLVGLENYTPEEAAVRWKALLDRARAGISFPIALDAPLRIVVILRTPFNTLASMMRGLTPTPPNHLEAEDFARAWSGYARECAGETSHLAPFGTVVPLLYDRWFIDAAYRAELAARLGLQFDDSGLGEMSVNGLGSSFEKSEQVDPRRLKVLERWREFENDPRYRRSLADAELLRLQRLHFGEPPFLP
ncbi:MAG TPA: hypothetical protein VIM58_09360, partial [Candidatus Methylacidiphilales bacterium]